MEHDMNRRKTSDHHSYKDDLDGARGCLSAIVVMVVAAAVATLLSMLVGAWSVPMPACTCLTKPDSWSCGDVSFSTEDGRTITGIAWVDDRGRDGSCLIVPSRMSGEGR